MDGDVTRRSTLSRSHSIIHNYSATPGLSFLLRTDRPRTRGTKRRANGKCNWSGRVGCFLLVVLQIRQEGRKPQRLQRRSPTQQAKTTLTLTDQIVGIAGPPFGVALRAAFLAISDDKMAGSRSSRRRNARLSSSPSNVEFGQLGSRVLSRWS